MDGSVNIILYQTLAKKNGVLVVISFPGHKSDQRVFTKCKLALVSRRTVCDYFAGLYMVTFKYDRFLVVAVALVASHEFGQMVNIFCSVIVVHADLVGAGIGNGSCFFRNDADTGVYGCFCFDTGSYNRSIGNHKRYGLTLHVGSHQRTVRIVVLKERDQRRSDGEYHLRRHVHVIKHVRLVGLGLIQITSGNVLVEEVSFCIQRLICLCYMVIILFICGHVDYFVGNTRIFRI